MKTKTLVILGGLATIGGLLLLRKRILSSFQIATPVQTVSGLGADTAPSSFDAATKIVNTSISTLTGGIALAVGAYSLKEKHKASRAPVAITVKKRHSKRRK